ncbi:uncharacterized protein DSM5745_01051 [Aspergillus mulundensis]|uniref:Major facilitator superfamily (MFS) profile domain-containing protein n=1 Tax=Aspergillus mulundensis TaxID=1810919 RepID=A0A3D8T5C2_9EURO|nr:Uncharacterized protein DSM5745_01051 [Aspergillus mulundensis]RDW93729.1 Uncharacterized protein DSM5745_01051 [Aspergillus mulundensis]
MADKVEKAELDVQVGQVHYTPEEEQRVLRKIDRTLLPLLCLVDFFQCESTVIFRGAMADQEDLDKQAIGYAAVFDLKDDLNMTSGQYSWSVSSFYFGQLLAQYVFIYLMSRFPVTRFVGCIVVIWGVCAACLAAPNGFAGFTAVRLLLGFFEAAIQPAFVIIVSSWYKKDEHSIRLAAWISCNGLSQILGALLMYGIGLSKDTAIATWRIMFLVCGGGTLLAGIVWFVLAPLGPDSAWFLDEHERTIAVARLSSERLSQDRQSFSKAQIWDIITDFRAWMLILGGFFNTLASPVIKFATLVINGFGWSKLNTMLVSLPAGAIQILFIWIVVVGIRVTSFPRYWWGVLACIPSLVGNIGVATLPSSSHWGIVVCTWLATILTPTQVIFLSLIASNIKGNTKKAAASNGYFILYAAACIAGPQLWTKPPRYTDGVITDIVSLGCAIASFISFGLAAGYENRRRDRLSSVASDDSTADCDLTDRQDLAFRYTL